MIDSDTDLNNEYRIQRDDVNIAHAHSIVIHLNADNVKAFREEMRGKAKHYSDVKVEINNRVIEMSFEEFEKRVFGDEK